MGEDEYEVESITQARVEKQRKRLVWKYRVRWKNYSPEDDTWEPVENFEGSEFIDRFWERANSGGRDVNNLNLFTVGEEFLPMGPPRRKHSRKSLKEKVPTDEQSVSNAEGSTSLVSSGLGSEKRRRSMQDANDEDDLPSKRLREHIVESNFTQDHTSKERIPLPGRSKKSTTHKGLPEKRSTSSEPSRRPEKKTKRSPSNEIIPASDEEMMEDTLFGQTPVKPRGAPKLAVTATDKVQLHRHSKSNSSNNESFQVSVSSSKNGSIASIEEIGPSLEAVAKSRPPKALSHRDRAAKPLVQMVDDPRLKGIDGAISAKARVIGRNVASSKAPSAGPSLKSRSHSASQKPGPGRSSTGFSTKRNSSLLTFEKGALKTIRGRYTKEIEKSTDETRPSEFVSNGSTEIEEMQGGSPSELFSRENSPVPTGEEIAQIAGQMAEEAGALPDFDDDNPISGSKLTEFKDAESAPNPSLTIVQGSLFPTTVTAPIPESSTAWRRPTIFGPLGLGSEPLLRPTSETPMTSTESTLFILSLDVSVSVPVFLSKTYLSPSGSPSLDHIIGRKIKGTPGKFYGEQAALALLDTFRTVGPSSRISIATSAIDSEKVHFERFCTRLNAGDLFIAVIGSTILAFCASDNALVAQRLNIPAALLGPPSGIIVTCVAIENFNAYATTALQAETVRWE